MPTAPQQESPPPIARLASAKPPVPPAPEPSSPAIPAKTANAAVGLLLRELRRRDRTDLYGVVLEANTKTLSGNTLTIGISERTDFSPSDLALCNTILKTADITIRPECKLSAESRLALAIARLKELGGNRFLFLP